MIRRLRTPIGDSRDAFDSCLPEKMLDVTHPTVRVAATALGRPRAPLDAIPTPSYVHATAGVPHWQAILLTTVAARVVVLPLMVSTVSRSGLSFKSPA